MIDIIHGDILQVNLNKYNKKINLVITSPPYNVGLYYHNEWNDTISYKEYLNWVRQWASKIYELLPDDGRIAINIPFIKNRGEKSFMAADFYNIFKEIGFNYKTTIIWNKNQTSRRTAWGSWLSASAPNVYFFGEVILVMYKKQWKRFRRGKSTITKEEFVAWTNGLWTITPAINAKKLGHPAPFPEHLVERLIKLFSYENDYVLDPFMGSGTTLVVAQKLNRHAIGVEISEKYIEIAKQRLSLP